MISCKKGDRERITAKMVYRDMSGREWFVKTAYTHMGSKYVTACKIEPTEETHELIDHFETSEPILKSQYDLPVINVKPTGKAVEPEWSEG